MAKSGGAIIDRDKYQYEKVTIVDAQGKRRTSHGNNDSVFRAMKKVTTTDGVRKLLKINGLADRAPSGNSGTYRMSVGNSLRAVLRRYEKDPDNEKPLNIAGIPITSFDQDIPEDDDTTTSAKKAPPAKKRTKQAAASRGRSSGSRVIASARRTARSATTSRGA